MGLRRGERALLRLLLRAELERRVLVRRVDADAFAAVQILDNHLVVRARAQDVLRLVDVLDRALGRRVGGRADDDGAVRVSVDEADEDLGARPQGEVHAIVRAGVRLHHPHGVRRPEIGTPRAVVLHAHVVAAVIVELREVSANLPVDDGIVQAGNARPGRHPLRPVRGRERDRGEVVGPVGAGALVLTQPIPDLQREQVLVSFAGVVQVKHAAGPQAHLGRRPLDDALARRQLLAAQLGHAGDLAGRLGVRGDLGPRPARHLGRDVVRLVEAEAGVAIVVVPDDRLGGRAAERRPEVEGRRMEVAVPYLEVGTSDRMKRLLRVGEDEHVATGPVIERRRDADVLAEPAHERVVGLVELNDELAPRVRSRQRQDEVRAGLEAMGAQLRLDHLRDRLIEKDLAALALGERPEARREDEIQMDLLAVVAGNAARDFGHDAMSLAHHLFSIFEP